MVSGNTLSFQIYEMLARYTNAVRDPESLTAHDSTLNWAGVLTSITCRAIRVIQPAQSLGMKLLLMEAFTQSKGSSKVVAKWSKAP